MYLFYADVFGYIPMGSDGQMHTNLRSDRAVRELARNFLHNRRGTVYGMASWTQEMSELPPAAFCRYIITHGKKYAEKD